MSNFPAIVNFHMKHNFIKLRINVNWQIKDLPSFNISYSQLPIKAKDRYKKILHVRITPLYINHCGIIVNRVLRIFNSTLKIKNKQCKACFKFAQLRMIFILQSPTAVGIILKNKLTAW